MITRIRRWGNSLGLRIPRNVAQDANLADGTSVDVEARGGRIVVTPVRPTRYSLDELLAGVTPSNRHEEVEFGEPTGRELW